MSKLVNKVQSAISNAKGTAGEAHQMYHYDQLVEEFGQDGADVILKKPLKNIGFTTDDFHTFVNIRRAITNGSLNIADARAEANKLVNGTINSDLNM